MTVHDQIWRVVPADRHVDPDVLEFALDACAREADRAGEPLRVLDLGCGDGRIAAELARAGARVSGTDPAPAALERARAGHPELDLRAPFTDGRLPFPDSASELVVCLQVLQHVADTQLLLSEVRRVLVPAGLLAVAVPWHGRLKSALTALRSFERHHDPLEPVLRFYTPRSLRGLLEQLGFEQVELAARGGLPLARATLLAYARRGAP